MIQVSQSILDNPIWNALSSRQMELSEGDVLARRFPADIGPLSGLVSQTSEAYASLARLAKPEEKLVLFLEEGPSPSSDWKLDFHGYLTQMVLEEELPQLPVDKIEPLTGNDVKAMLALTKLTNPGPFRERTRVLGTYVGIKESGRLVAMAGERLRMDGYTEISAVCTHPDFQGRGYAKALMVSIANGIIGRGETPFLHAWRENFNAIEVYKKLGFVHRRELHVAVLQRP